MGIKSSDPKRLLPFKLSRLFLLTLVFLCLVAATFAARRERLIESWRPLHYKIAVVLDDRLSTITTARADITIHARRDNLSLIDLDFGELTVDSVAVDGQPMRFEHANGRLNVMLKKRLALEERAVLAVTYHGTPKDGLILSSDGSGKPSAIGDNWPDRVHHWIPTLDHPSAKATVSFSVTAPDRTLVVANGALDQVTTAAGGARTWTYTEHSPIPAYCMVIAVGEFALLKPDVPAVTPLSYYVPLIDKEVAKLGFGSASPSLKFFSETIAPYPYEKLAMIVGATRFGGMENAGAIVFSNNVFATRYDLDPISKVFNVRPGLVSLVAHEIAHQWFGDSVTESTWADLWLSEGFATYFAGLFHQRYEGEPAFRQYMKAQADVYLNYAKRTRNPLFDTETDNLLSLLNPNNYQKGAWVLHMLRGRLGDEAFFKGLRAYYRKHEHATASSEDLRASLEHASGLDLKEFFARWVYGAGHPHYEMSWNWQSVKRGRNSQNRGGTLTIRLNQKQPEEPFLDPLEVEIVTAKGSQKTRITVTGRDSVIKLTTPSRPNQIRLDPEERMLKEVVSR